MPEYVEDDDLTASDATLDNPDLEESNTENTDEVAELSVPEKEQIRSKPSTVVTEAKPKTGGGTPANKRDTRESLPAPELLLLEEPAARESNLLQLQVTELLNELRFNYDDESIMRAFAELAALLEALPEQIVQPGIARDFFGSLKISAKRALNFKAPEAVRMTGAFASRTTVLPESVIDVIVVIPASCFLDRDHVDHQYHARRALYLATIAIALKKHPRFKRQRWEYQYSDPRKPVLVVNPTAQGSTTKEKFSFRILTAIPRGTFRLVKLEANKNNLRSMISNESKNDERKLLPTPHYNSSILQDIVSDSYSELLQKASIEYHNFLDALLLLKVWARKQGLDHNPDDFGGELLTALAAHTASTGLLNPAMSAVQILKAFLKTLSEPKTFKAGIFMERHFFDGLQPAPPPMSFKGLFEVLVVDPSGWLNLAAHVSQAALHQMQNAAKGTLAVLSSLMSAEAAFGDIFPPQRHSTASYDYFWRVTPTAADPRPLLAADLSLWRLQERELLSICRRALTDRIISVRAFRSALTGTSSLEPPSLKDSCILLAAKANPATVGRAVDVGPSADSAQAAAFRRFWGNKSDLRRFQDGKICEAVAWEVGPSQRHALLDSILQHLLALHLPRLSVSGFANVLDWVLCRKGSSADEQVIASRDMDASLVALGKELRSLSKLALRVTSIHPLSPCARRTSAGSPLPHPFAGRSLARGGSVQRCLQPVEVLVQLEGSGRWPEAPQAYQKMRAALGVQIAKELTDKFHLRTEASEDCVDVFKDGFVFRLHLASERDNALSHKAPEFAAEQESKQRRAAHHGFITKLAAEHPSYRAACQLASRWVSSHLLSNHVQQEAVELVVASAYCPGRILGTPGSPLAGFLQFLSTLAEHHWREGPLFVDPDNVMDATRRQSCIPSFAEAKKNGIAPNLPIATPSDPASAHWTAMKPQRQVVGRMVALASRGLSILQGLILSGNGLKKAVAAVYDPLLADFDALLVLRSESIPNRDLALRLDEEADGASKSKGLEHWLACAGFPGNTEGEEMPSKASRAVLRSIPADVVATWGVNSITKELLVGFDPVKIFVRLLEERYSHLGHFFADYDGSNVVAIKWQPKAFHPAYLEAAIAHTAMPLSIQDIEPALKKPKLLDPKKGAPLVIPDLVRVLGEFRDIGLGFVSDVRLQYSDGI